MIIPFIKNSHCAALKVGSLLIFLFGFVSTSGQECLPDGIHFETQQDINNFSQNYPGCTVILGDVCIGNCEINGDYNGSITNLNGLSGLESIDGKLSIHRTSALTRLEGLEGLSQIGGGLSLELNQNLNNLSALSGISEINGDVELSANSQLNQLDGLHNVNRINGDFLVDVPRHNDFDGLENLKEIGGNFVLSGVYEPQQISMSGLNNLKSIAGALEVKYTTLEDFTGLIKLEEIGGLILNDNDDLLDLDGLEQIDTINGDFSIAQNIKLRDLSAISNVLSINGDMIFRDVFRAEITDLTKLTTIEGDLVFRDNMLFDTLTGFNSLSKVGGDLYIHNNVNLKVIDAFESLDTVGNILNILNNSILHTFSEMNALQYVGDDLRISGVELTSIPAFPNLNYIGGNYSIRSCINLEQFDLPNPDVVNGLVLDYNPNLTNITCPWNVTSFDKDLRIFNNGIISLNLPSTLTRIEGVVNIVLNQSLLSFSGLENLEYVGRNLGISSNGPMPQIDIFNNIDTIVGGLTLQGTETFNTLSSFNNLTSVSSINIADFTALDDLNLFPGIDSVDFLVLRNLPAIASLMGLSNLNHIGSISLTELNNIEDLSGLENVTKLDGYIRIDDNDELTSLNGIQNIEPQSINYSTGKDIIITDNSKLTDCAIQSICEALINHGADWEIEDNAPGCNSVADINCTKNTISGHVYFDANQNGERDVLEFGIPGIPISIESLNTKIITNVDGRFLYVLEPGINATFEIETPADFTLTSSPESYSITFNPDLVDENSMYDFGLYKEISDLNVETAFNSAPTRCNTTVNFYYTYQNLSNQVLDGDIYLQIDPLSTYRSASESSFSINGGRRFAVNDLQPFEPRDIIIEIEMPDELSTGEEVVFTTEFISDAIQMEVITETDTLSSSILCSYDPNDKNATPVGVYDDNLTLKDDTINYKIRFQNTGNAAAINITIRDTISPFLDMNTFKVTQSSFPVQTYIDGYNIEFYFRDIWLLDSLTDETASHGFITYQIQPIEGLDDFTLIENTAHIIFDFNPPIITNTTFNSLVDEICTFSQIEIDTTICFGETYMGESETGQFEFSYLVGGYCDSIILLNLTVFEEFSPGEEYFICPGDSILVNGAYVFDEGQYITPFTSIEGCDSTLVTTLTFLDVADPECITSLENAILLNVEIVPNPFTEFITIKSDQILDRVKIFTSTGIRIANHSIISTEFSLETSNWPEGLYFIEVHAGNMRSSKRIIKN